PANCAHKSAGSMIRAALLALTALAVAASVLPFSRRPEWWIRLWDFPRVQIAIFCAAVAAALHWLRPLDVVWIMVALVALLAGLGDLVVVVVPYPPLWRPELQRAASAAAERSFSQVVANVLMANRGCEGLFEQLTLTYPDIILSLEPDTWWGDRLS